MRYVLPFLLAGALMACGDEAGSAGSYEEPAEPIAFRDDGDLTFLRSGDELVRIDIEIAETESARQRGLMQRASLPESSGMLFLFDREETQRFHMANTPLGLDLLFVGSDSQIVDIKKYNRPFDQSTIVSDAPAQYVIEVPAGFADTYGIVEGERVSWQRSN